MIRVCDLGPDHHLTRRSSRPPLGARDLLTCSESTTSSMPSASTHSDGQCLGNWRSWRSSRWAGSSTSATFATAAADGATAAAAPGDPSPLPPLPPLSAASVLSSAAGPRLVTDLGASGGSASAPAGDHRGILYIVNSKNNIHMTLVKPDESQVITNLSAGCVGFKGAAKRKPGAAEKVIMRGATSAPLPRTTPRGSRGQAAGALLRGGWNYMTCSSPCSYVWRLSVCSVGPSHHHPDCRLPTTTGTTTTPHNHRVRSRRRWCAGP